MKAPPARQLEPCAIVDNTGEPCPNNAQRGRALCHAHQKRKSRLEKDPEAIPIDAPLVDRELEPLALLQKTAIAYAEADTGNHRDWANALDRLRYAAKVYVNQSKTRPRLKRLASCGICGRPVYALGLCERHYHQRRRRTAAEWRAIRASETVRQVSDHGERG